MAARTSWTEEEDDFLRRSLAQGCTYIQAAAELEAVFGNGRSPNALIGRAARKGFATVRVSRAKPSAPTLVKPLAKPSAPKPRAAKPPVPARPASTAPALRPPAKQKHNANNIRVRATRHLDERFDEVRAQRLAEVAAFEAKLDQAGGINPGVLFLERDMVTQCAAPMPGWDQAPITEKRVCGAPVEWRPVNIGGITVEQPSSWCTACRKRFTVASDRRGNMTKLASLDRSVRRAA